MSEWTTASARETYSIRHWSDAYFDIADDGLLQAQPSRDPNRQVPLADVVSRARAEGLRLPLLVRFPDVLRDKSQRMVEAFDQARAASDYAGGYTAVFPIKVNQQRAVVEELTAASNRRLGFEAGSKPELMAVLAMSPGGVVICNGYKDREYVRLALIGLKLGLDVFIVLEKAGELRLVLEEARALGVVPMLGVRLRLASIGAGKWQNTGGEKAKFGLSPRQVLDVVEVLRQQNMMDCLSLVHFHMGSQLSNVRDISTGLREACQYFVELHRLGAPIAWLDVGGGLAVDYEGTRSRSFCSMNYGLAQYANAVVAAIADVCREHSLPEPHLITEAGRAMSAHHAVLITQISAVEPVPDGSETIGAESTAHAVQRLREILHGAGERAPAEMYQDAQHYLAEGQSLFALGHMSLADRAALDDLYYAIVHRVRAALRPELRVHRDVLDQLNARLTDKYFANFSVFQSVPDVWAIDQVFPIVPLARLDEEPTRRGVLEDLTCDSDGRIDLYVDSEGLEPSLPMHELRSGEPYLLGLFMVGAYQETLGDIHNLFGDTDSVNVRLTDDGFRLERAQRGDTAERVLGYVGFDPQDLVRRFDAKLARAGLPQAEAERYRWAMQAGLGGSTYLSDGEG